MRCIASLLVLFILSCVAGCGASDVQAVDVPEGPAPQRAVTSIPRVSAPVETHDAVADTAHPAALAQQSPGEAIRSMLELAEAGMWATFVDRYYGESEKFRSDTDRDALVARFEGEWGQRMVSALRDAAELTPTIEGGDRAVFLDGNMPVFMLYKHADGRWTFHL